MCIRANIDITIVEGGTFNKTFQWKIGDPALPVDLTGYSARMQIRSKLKDTDSLLDAEFNEESWTADGDTGIYFYSTEDEYDEDMGKWRIYLRDDDTQGLCANHKDIIGVYDLFLYSPAGEAVLQQYGTATICASVTRDE
jgi:hypothetical protein